MHTNDNAVGNHSTKEKSGVKKMASKIADTLGRIPSPAAIPDAATYFYIKEIKKWMECPACGANLLFDEETQSWTCEDCNFVLPEDEFLNGYVFWFCDHCDEFLNTQEGFDSNEGIWKCTECGHANDVTDANLKGTCMECGELLDDPNATLCKECETERLEKMAIALEKASQDIKSLKS